MKDHLQIKGKEVDQRSHKKQHGWNRAQLKTILAGNGESRGSKDDVKTKNNNLLFYLNYRNDKNTCRGNLHCTL